MTNGIKSKSQHKAERNAATAESKASKTATPAAPAATAESKASKTAAPAATAESNAAGAATVAESIEQKIAKFFGKTNKELHHLHRECGVSQESAAMLHHIACSLRGMTRQAAIGSINTHTAVCVKKNGDVQATVVHGKKEPYSEAAVIGFIYGTQADGSFLTHKKLATCRTALGSSYGTELCKAHGVENLAMSKAIDKLQALIK